MQLFLGIDGGGTGCRAALSDASGAILAEAEGGPANVASDLNGTASSILAVARDVLTNVLGASAQAAALPRLRVAMGLAGANIPGCADQLRAKLPFVNPHIGSDAITAVKGALHDGDGIVAAIGTGSVFVRQLDGVAHSIGGRGLVLGDEGSGAWMGRALLSASLRACDGFAGLTPLLQSVLDEAGGDGGVMAFAATARPADYARFARRIVGSDDPAARAVMAAARADIAASIALLQPARPVAVVFLGGLGGHFAAQFAKDWQVQPALGRGVDGALWLARQMRGVA